MRVTKGKKIRTVILIVVFTLLIGVMLMGFRLITEVLKITVSGHIQTEHALEKLDQMTEQLSDDSDVILAQRNIKRKIIARALQQKDFSGWDGQICAFGDGYVAELDGNVLHLPPDACFLPASEVSGEELPELTEEQKSTLQIAELFF